MNRGEKAGHHFEHMTHPCVLIVGLGILVSLLKFKLGS